MVFNLPRNSLGLSLCQQRQQLQLIFRISNCFNNGIADSQNYSRREFFHFSTELDKLRITIELSLYSKFVLVLYHQ